MKASANPTELRAKVAFQYHLGYISPWPLAEPWMKLLSAAEGSLYRKLTAEVSPEHFLEPRTWEVPRQTSCRGAMRYDAQTAMVDVSRMPGLAQVLYLGHLTGCPGYFLCGRGVA